MAQLFETLCMMLAFKESHSLAVHYCRLVWDVRSLRNLFIQHQNNVVTVPVAGANTLLSDGLIIMVP